MTSLAPTYDFKGYPVRRLVYRGELAFMAREIGAVLLVDGMPEPTFTTKWANLGGERGPRRPS